MADRPSNYPRWASQNIVDPVSGETNVVEPPSAHKDEGWQRKEIPPRQWQNWLARQYYDWIVYLDEAVHKLDTHTVAQLPSASNAGKGAIVYVTNEVGGEVPAFSDGSNWRRMTDRTIVSS